MGIDLDPSDDIFAVGAVKNGRSTGKFQPKAKLRTPRSDSSPTSISSSHTMLTNEAAKIKLANQCNFGSESFLDEKVAPEEIADPAIRTDSGSDVMLDDNGGWQSLVEKSVNENADIFIELDSLDDFIPHITSNMEGTPSPPETIAVVVSNSNNGEGRLGIPVLSSIDHPILTNGATDALSCPSAVGDPTVSSSNGVGHMGNRVMEPTEMDIMDMGNVSDLVTKSDKRTGKFRPNPKTKMQKEICEVRIESVSSPFCSAQVPPDIDFANKDSVPAFEHEDVLDLASVRFSHALPVEATFDLPVNDGSMNPMEMSQFVSEIRQESVPEVPTKLASRRARARMNETPTASDFSQPQENAFPSIEENEPGRSLRPRKTKTNLCELVDESEDECPCSSALDEDNINNEEFQIESEFQTRKDKRKSTKQDGDKEKTSRKSKISKGSSEQDGDVKPKRFSHSTRRRKVDKVLLETPEDEIDYQKVPLRDLILLAEHKERQMKKEESVPGEPLTEPSHDDPSEFFNDDNDEHVREDSSIYYNYQTYMDRTPITRWSKQDTELFYEGVRQFGTDLSLIQQLFPGRTRRQVKLKYKKEERQQPLRLRDALTNRSRDHSHFETVIERLQQMAAKENENADNDGSTEMGDNAAPEIPDVNDGEPTNEQYEGQQKEGDIGQGLREDGGLPEDKSPSNFYGSDDDLFRWSQYRSDA